MSVSTLESMREDWADFVASLELDWWEVIIYLPDIDPDNMLAADFHNASVRREQLIDELQKDRPEWGRLQDIKIAGFSEGAAAVAQFLDTLSKDSGYLSESVASELRAAIMLERPAGPGADGYMYRRDYDLANLPERLAENPKLNIKIADIYNRASPVHNALGGYTTTEGWEDVTHSYDSRGWLERNTYGADLSPLRFTTLFNKYHKDILHSSKAIDEANKAIGGN